MGDSFMIISPHVQANTYSKQVIELWLAGATSQRGDKDLGWSRNACGSITNQYVHDADSRCKSQPRTAINLRSAASISLSTA